MELIRRMEQMGYKFDERLTFYYDRHDNTPPPEAEILLAELPAHKDEAILYLIERNNYPAHIRLSEQYRTAIVNGILNAKSPFELLLQAIECISYMTGDIVFLKQNCENIKDVYGVGLLEPVPLEIELQEVQRRLVMLRRPELQSEPSDSRERIQKSIIAHEQRESEIINLLGKSRKD